MRRSLPDVRPLTHFTGGGVEEADGLHDGRADTRHQVPLRGQIPQLSPAHQDGHPGVVGGGRHRGLEDETGGDLRQVGFVGEDEARGEVLVLPGRAGVVRETQLTGLMRGKL